MCLLLLLLDVLHNSEVDFVQNLEFEDWLCCTEHSIEHLQTIEMCFFLSPNGTEKVSSIVTMILNRSSMELLGAIDQTDLVYSVSYPAEIFILKEQGNRKCM